MTRRLPDWGRILVVAAGLVAGVAGFPIHAADAAENVSGKQSTAAAKSKPHPSTANRFNRLFRGKAQFNLPPTEDGIHDPESPGTQVLQSPREAFEGLPKSRSGNRVNWSKALRDKLIPARADRLDPNKKQTLLDLNIVREVKGTMPDVVYPHQAHTEWLECRNCHPKIFIPKKGANKISMAAILMGQYCGVCHGKVAFPVSECRLCHSKAKTPEELKKRKQRRQTAQTVALTSKGVDAKTQANPPAPPKAKTVSVDVQDLAPPPQVNGAKHDTVPMTQQALLDLGKNVYSDYCSGCHGENGQGIPNTFPPLKASKVATGPLNIHLAIVLDGKAETSMQPWKDQLNAREIAAVITFERNAWGNAMGDVVQPAQVVKMLNRTSDVKEAASESLNGSPDPTPKTNSQDSK